VATDDPRSVILKNESKPLRGGWGRLGAAVFSEVIRENP